VCRYKRGMLRHACSKLQHHVLSCAWNKWTSHVHDTLLDLRAFCQRSRILQHAAFCGLLDNARRRRSIRRAAARFVHRSQSRAWSAWVALLRVRLARMTSADSIRRQILNKWTEDCMTTAFAAFKMWKQRQQGLRTICAKVSHLLGTCAWLNLMQ
jgi:hypothetical protein